MKKKLLIIVIIIKIYGCNNSITEPVNASIEPIEKSEYFADDLITFETKNSIKDLEWKSSIDGILGKGNKVIKKLSVGEHIIQLIYEETILDSIEITVKDVVYIPGNNRKITLYKESNYLDLPSGKYSPFFYSTSNQVMITGVKSRSIRINDESDSILSLKSFQRIDNTNIRSEIVKNLNRSILNNIKEKEFIVADTTNVIESGIKIKADLLYSENRVNLWLDKESKKNIKLIDEIWIELKNIIIPRVLTLWGEWADIDNNDAVNILITPLINEQNKAIGFFNPADLHPYNNDINSSDYNVVTNEMDIIYIGDPSYDENSFAYSKNSLLATISHEITHLINYSNKVYFPMVNSGVINNKEELFLDEGLAHLTESLCGYGVSGGNIAFFSRYLEDPGYYSIKYANAGGLEDSIGRRGFVSAFLSWLFWKSGGAKWSSVDPGNIEDKGGISFLKKLLYSDLTGWENLNYSLNGNINKYFYQWVDEINKVDAGYLQLESDVIDPITMEVITISPFYGDVEINSKTYSLNGPKRIELNENNMVLPYSYTFIESIDIEQDLSMEILGETNKGLVIACFSMY